MVKDIIVVIIALLALIAITIGFYMIWVPLGFIIGGSGLFLTAVIMDSQKGGDNKQ